MLVCYPYCYWRPDHHQSPWSDPIASRGPSGRCPSWFAHRPCRQTHSRGERGRCDHDHNHDLIMIMVTMLVIMMVIMMVVVVKSFTIHKFEIWRNRFTEPGLWRWCRAWKLGRGPRSSFSGPNIHVATFPKSCIRYISIFPGTSQYVQGSSQYLFQVHLNHPNQCLRLWRRSRPWRNQDSPSFPRHHEPQLSGESLVSGVC